MNRLQNYLDTILTAFSLAYIILTFAEDPTMVIKAEWAIVKFARKVRAGVGEFELWVYEDINERLELR